MGATYTRQSSYTDGDTITAAHTNDEFNQLLAAFAASTGHTHDGTTAEGGPITKLLGNTLTFGAATAGTDITVTFDGESNDGVLKWMEDEDYFEFSDDILVASTEKLQFRDTAIYIHSSADGQLDLIADTEIQIAATTVDINGNVDISGTLTIGGAGISEAELEILDGATVTTTEINIMDGDTSASATTVADADRVVFNDAGTMKQVAVTDLAAYFDDEITAMPNLVTTAATTVGALNSGSITSGFGTIDTGSSTITTTGLISGGSLDIDDVLINGTTIGHTDDTDLMTVASGLLTVAGEVSMTTLDIGGTNVTSTAAELNYSDTGAAVGTVVASKVVTADANKDVASFRNITLTGELDAGSLDVSGDADIDGTLEADAITVNGTALNTVIAGVTVANATLAATTTVTDSTANTNFPVVFHDESNALLDDTGALRYNPSTGELLVPKLTVAGTTTTVDTVTMNAENAIIFEGATADAHETTLTIVDPTADRTINLPNQSGTVPLLAAASNTAVTSTPEELNILDGATVVVGEINALDLGSTAVGTAVASKAVILDSNKDYTGIRNFTTTGVITGGTLEATTDTAAGDNAAIGYTAAEGLILTGQGSTNDVTIKNDADADVLEIPTGTINVTVAGDLTAGATVKVNGDTAAGDTAAIGYTSAEGLILTGQGSTSDITLKNDADATVFTVPTGTDDILFPDSAKILMGAGSDLQIYHDGSNSFIDDAGTGNVFLRGSSQVIIGNMTGEQAAVFNDNGAVTINYDNAQKLATTNTGIDVTGVITTDGMTTSADINFGDNDKAIFGAGSDLQISHNGSYSLIADSGTGNLILACEDFSLTNPAVGENMITAAVDGAVTLYHDNAAKLATTADGVDITGDTAITGHASIGVDAINSGRALTVAGATDGSSSSILVLYNSSLASKFAVRDDGFVSVAGNMDITTSDNSNNLTLTSTDADANTGPNLVMTRASGSPADNDAIGELTFNFNNDADENTVGTRWRNFIIDASNGTEDAAFDIFSMKAGALTSIINYDASTLSFNDGSADIDFRVESDDDANAFFVEGSSGNVGIGTASPTLDSGLAGLTVNSGGTLLQVNNGDGATLKLTDPATGANRGLGISLQGTEAVIANCESGSLRFGTSNANRMHIDASGNVGIGRVPATGILDLQCGNTTALQAIRIADTSPTEYFGVFNANEGGKAPNAANATLKVRGMNTTDRAINAGGTVNASGADYAEYMTKADGCGTIAKGAVCGVDADGNLTDVFANAHSFVIKSTDPSYVGGDVWSIASTDADGNQTTLEGDALEAARQKVDRIAFSGQVPCTISGTTKVGDFVIAQAKSDGGIEAVAVTSPTFEQYSVAIGKVWKLGSSQHTVAVKIS